MIGRYTVVRAYSPTNGMPRDAGHACNTPSDVLALVAAHHHDDPIKVRPFITNECVECFSIAGVRVGCAAWACVACGRVQPTKRTV